MWVVLLSAAHYSPIEFRSFLMSRLAWRLLCQHSLIRHRTAPAFRVHVPFLSAREFMFIRAIILHQVYIIVDLSVNKSTSPN